jgi:uncharacterized protein YndB with AHSA1/START domain
MTSNAPGGGHLLGSLRSADGKGVVRIEDRYDAGTDALWSAITDPGQLVRWYARVDGQLGPGGDIHIYVEGDDWEGTGRIEACEPPRRLVVTTRESEESWRRGQGVPPYDQRVEATLTADGAQTVLAVEVQGMPLDGVAFYGAGWQIHAEHLAAYLAGREPGDSEARWDELVPGYQELAAGLG